MIDGIFDVFSLMVVGCSVLELGIIVVLILGTIEDVELGMDDGV